MNEILNRPLILKKNSKSKGLISFSGEGNYFFDKILRSLYIALLFVLNFVMFIYSINAKIIENGEFNQAVLYIVGSFCCFAFAIIFLLSFSMKLQNLVSAFFTLIFVVVFYYQFATFDVDIFVKELLQEYAKWFSFICVVPSVFFIGGVLAILVFFLFRHRLVMFFVTFVLLIALVVGVLKNEQISINSRDYLVVKDLRKNVGFKRDTNIVYFMVPNFPSYQFFNTVKDDNFRELRNLIIGFFAVNDFEIYPNAFVENKNAIDNVVDIFNHVDYTSSSSMYRGYSEYINNWNFIHGALDVLSLEENILYSFLEQDGYGLSIYAMPEFNMCLTGGELNTDRCVVKTYKTVALYDKEKSLEKNIYTLLSEWLLNIKGRELKSIARTLYRKSSISKYKVTAENRRVSLEGAAGVFNILTKQFLRDDNGQVYMVYVDLPSDMYIYDEYCNLKPRENWISLKDNSLNYVGIDEKRKAYTDQAKCLLGKMQEFIDEMELAGKDKNTDIYVQGVSAIADLGAMSADDYGNFVNNKLVGLGVRKHKKAKFLINANICLASDFTKTLIKNEDFCYTVDNMSIGEIRAKSLRQQLLNNSVLRSGKITSIAVNYNDWYEKYKSNNVTYVKKIRNKQIIKEKEIDVALEKIEQEQQELKKEDDVRSEVEETKSSDQVFLPDNNLVFDIEVEEMPTPVEKAPVIIEAPVVEEVVAVEEAPVAIEEFVAEKEEVIVQDDIKNVVSDKDVLEVIDVLEDLAPEDAENAKKIIKNVEQEGVNSLVDVWLNE